MKKLITIILLLITIGLIAPKFIGSIVETEHQSGISQLNENPAIIIKSTNFTRQWFTGKAVTEVTILIQDEGIEDITLIVEEDLSFGPVLFTRDGLAFALGHSQASINAKKLPIDEEITTFINDKIQLSGLITFSKNIVATISVDEISQEVDGNKVSSAKAFGHFTIEDSKRIYGNFDWAGLTAQTKEETLTLSDIHFSLDQTLIAGSYYQGNAISTGDFDFSLDSIEAKSTKNSKENKTIFSFDKFLINAESALNDDLMTVTMNYNIDKAEYAGQKLKNAKLALILSDLNIMVMQEINTIIAELPVDGAGVFAPEKMEKLSRLIATLLADKPMMEVEALGVETSHGNIESSMQISFDESLFNTANIMSIIPAIKANANGKAPEPFFTELGFSSVVDMYIEQGLVTKNDDELSVKINFSQGKLRINDKVIPM